MALLISPRPCRNGRYPRWGYLERHLVNEFIARAAVLSIALHLAAFCGYLAWKHFRPPHAPALPRPAPISHTVDIFEIHNKMLGIKPAAQVKMKVQREQFNVVPQDTPVDELFLDSSKGGSGSYDQDATADDSFADDIGSESVGGPLYPGADDFVAIEVEPELVHMDHPEYPELAREARVEGTVLVRVLVDVDGRVIDALVLQSVLTLDDAALAAARTAVFRSALQAGRPVPVWVNIPIEFRLRD